MTHTHPLCYTQMHRARDRFPKAVRPSDSPGENNNEVHDVPSVSQVGVLVEGKAEGQDLYSGLETEDADEIRLCVILEERRPD